jgi:hypothetical protein
VSTHRSECEDFSRRTAGDEVEFLTLDYVGLVKDLSSGKDPGPALHAGRLAKAFDIG